MAWGGLAWWPLSLLIAGSAWRRAGAAGAAASVWGAANDTAAVAAAAGTAGTATSGVPAGQGAGASGAGDHGPGFGANATGPQFRAPGSRQHRWQRSHQSQGPCRGGAVRQGLCDCRWPAQPVWNQSANTTDCLWQNCGSGNFSVELGRCMCHEGWRVAGITNPMEFVQGRCTQYQCRSDEVCQQELQVVGATCPVPGMNCQCGLFGILQARNSGNAQCMYPWWAVIFSATSGFRAVLKNLWFLALFVAAGLLPFGKNVVGTAEGYSPTVFSHDVAWSIFALKLGVWMYAFVTACYLSFMCLWASAVVVLAAVGTVCACLAACGEGAAFSEGSCGEACAGEHCCECCCASGAGDVGVSPLTLYAGDPYCCSTPYFWYGGPVDGDCECCCGPRWQRLCQRCLWFPCFRVLAAVAPRLPENMLGGVLGLAVGTHPLRNNYAPNSPVVRALAAPCWSISRRGERWRRSVYQWLHEVEATEAAAMAGVRVAEARPDGASRVAYAGVLVEREPGSFTVADRIFNHDDFENNQCWICQHGSNDWDLWTSCRHVFCDGCSSEMLRRQMPCPLCRVRSRRVVRRRRAGVELESMDAGEEGALLDHGGSEGARARGQRGRRMSWAAAPLPQQIPPSRARTLDDDDV